MTEVLEKTADVVNSVKKGNHNYDIGDDKIDAVVLINPFADNLARFNLSFFFFKMFMYSYFLYLMINVFVEFIIKKQIFEEATVRAYEILFTSILWFYEYLFHKCLSLFDSLSYAFMSFLQGTVGFIWKIVYKTGYMSRQESINFFNETYQYLNDNKDWSFIIKIRGKEYNLLKDYFFNIPELDKYIFLTCYAIVGFIFCLFVLQYWIQKRLYSSRLKNYTVLIFDIWQFYRRKENKKLRLYLLKGLEHEKFTMNKITNYQLSGLFDITDYEKYELNWSVKMHLNYFSVLEFELKEKEDKKPKEVKENKNSKTRF